MNILTFDIETSPHLSYHWRRWQENIPYQNTIEESETLCWAAKWFGEKKVMSSTRWNDGQDAMMEGIWELLDEADVVVGFNSQKFDIKRVNSEFVLRGWAPPSPYKQVDLLLKCRQQFGFSSNRLKDILKRLGLSMKLEDNANMELWMDVVNRELKGAQKRMDKYCQQDVRSTEELYEYILGWIKGHPNWALFLDDTKGKPTCPNCGSDHVTKKGVETTKIRKYQRYQCQSCGAYHRGRRSIEPVGSEVLA